VVANQPLRRWWKLKREAALRDRSDGDRDDAFDPLAQVFMEIDMEVCFIPNATTPSLQHSASWCCCHTKPNTFTKCHCYSYSYGTPSIKHE
jgi:hypothetical protein